MSVEPEAPEPRWAVPPVGGWTADDLDRLPHLPPQTELIDGSLVFASPQTLTGIFHDRMKVSAPFPMDLDLSLITPRRRSPEQR